jgi:hypothetical protein
MAASYSIRSFLRKSKYFKESISFNRFILNSLRTRTLCTFIEQPKSKNGFKYSLVGAFVGFTLGTGYTLKKINDTKQKSAVVGTEIEAKLLKRKPDVKPSRTVWKWFIYLITFI